MISAASSDAACAVECAAHVSRSVQSRFCAGPRGSCSATLPRTRDRTASGLMIGVGARTTARSTAFRARGRCGQSADCSLRDAWASPSMRLPPAWLLGYEVFDEHRGCHRAVPGAAGCGSGSRSGGRTGPAGTGRRLHLAQVAVGRRDHPHVDFACARSRAARTRAPAALAQLAWMPAHGPDFVEKIVRRRQERLPFLLLAAPVNASALPKSSDSSSVSGMAAQLTLMSGSRAARLIVNRTGHHPSRCRSRP